MIELIDDYKALSNSKGEKFMACRCIDIKNCLNDIITMKKIVKEFSELEENNQRLNDNLNKISSVGILITDKEKELISNHRKVNKKLVDKMPLIINECNVRIKELEKQFRIIMKEDDMFHYNQNKKSFK